MISQVEANGPDYWPIMGSLLVGLITGILGYRLGLHSQKANAKMQARHTVFVKIDLIAAEAAKMLEARPIFYHTKDALRELVFAFNCFPSARNRSKIQQAYKEYEELKLEFFLSPIDTVIDYKKADAERQMLLDALTKLRNRIAKS